MARFDEFLRRVERKFTIDDSVVYSCVGVRGHGIGAFVRERLLGMSIARKKQWIIRSGDVVYNKLFAWRGSFAIADESVDGCIVSDKFPTYTIEKCSIDPRFLGFYFRTPEIAQQALRLSKGSAAISKLTLNPPEFWDLTIPMPPLEEQQRIVMRIEELAARIERARLLRHQTLEETGRLLIAMAHRDDLDLQSKLQVGWRQVAIGDLVKLVDEQEIVKPSSSYPNLGIYSFGRGIFAKPPIDGMMTSAKSLRRVRAGQFIYSRLFAFEGAYAIVPSEFDGFYVSGEYPTFACDRERVTPEFLWAYFKSPRVWKVLAAESKGLGDRRQRVQPAKILSHRIVVPPLEWQHRIALMQSKVEALRHLQTRTVDELNALLPSILDKAFKGDL